MILIRSVFNLITSSPSGTYCHSEHFPEFSQQTVLLWGTWHHLDFLLPAPLVSSPDKAQWHSCNEDVLSCLTQLRCVHFPAKRLLNVTPAHPHTSNRKNAGRTCKTDSIYFICSKEDIQNGSLLRIKIWHRHINKLLFPKSCVTEFWTQLSAINHNNRQTTTIKKTKKTRPVNWIQLTL